MAPQRDIYRLRMVIPGSKKGPVDPVSQVMSVMSVMPLLKPIGRLMVKESREKHLAFVAKSG